MIKFCINFFTHFLYLCKIPFGIQWFFDYSNAICIDFVNKIATAGHYPRAAFGTKDSTTTVTCRPRGTKGLAGRADGIKALFMKITFLLTFPENFENFF